MDTHPAPTKPTPPTPPTPTHPATHPHPPTPAPTPTPTPKSPPPPPTRAHTHTHTHAHTHTHTHTYTHTHHKRTSTGKNTWNRRALPDTGGGREIMQARISAFQILHKNFVCNVFGVFLRICAGNNSKRPLFLMSNYWEPYAICSLIFKKWHRFCRARICRFIFSPTRNMPPPWYVTRGDPEPPGAVAHFPHQMWW